MDYGFALLSAADAANRRFQGWKTFLRTHAAGITSLDLFVLRTISFKLLYGLVILPHARRRLIAMSVTVPIPLPSDFAGQ